ncbi:acyltransferase family protein [Pseudooceanicola sp. C21-150M6]
MVEQSPAPRDSKPLPVLGIDLLRIFAALSVVAFHLGFKALNDSDGLIATMTALEPRVPVSWPLIWWGWVGVQIFFVVSGLVISFSACSARATGARFVRSRVLRLVPAVLIAAVFAFVVEILFFDMPVAKAVVLWVKTVTFFPLPPWLMGQFWTLGVEIGFYVVVLALVILRRQTWLPALGYLAIGLCGAYWAARIAGGGTDPFGRITQLILLQHGTYFGIGILLADMNRRGSNHWPAIIAGLAVAAVQIRISAGWEAGAAGLQGYWPVAFAVFALTVGFTAIALRYNATVHAALTPGTAQAIRTAGLMTYPLYLLHNHTGKPVIVLAVDMGVPLTLAVILAIAVSILAAWVVARFLEPRVYVAVASVYDSVKKAVRPPATVNS